MLAYLSTRSIVHAIPLIVTWRSAVVIGLKICEYKSIIPTLPRLPCVFGYTVFIDYNPSPRVLLKLTDNVSLRDNFGKILKGNCNRQLRCNSYALPGPVVGSANLGNTRERESENLWKKPGPSGQPQPTTNAYVIMLHPFFSLHTWKTSL